jgi:hypothetical protein
MYRLAAEFQVARNTIRAVLTGKVWPDCVPPALSGPR